MWLNNLDDDRDANTSNFYGSRCQICSMYQSSYFAYLKFKALIKKQIPIFGTTFKSLTSNVKMEKFFLKQKQTCSCSLFKHSIPITCPCQILNDPGNFIQYAQPKVNELVITKKKSLTKIVKQNSINAPIVHLQEDIPC